MKRLTRGRVLSGAGGGAIVAQGSLSHGAGTVADGAGTSYTGAVTGVAFGDMVTGLGPSQSFSGAVLSAYLDAAGTVLVRIQNESGGTVTWVAGSINYRVERPTS